MWTVYVVYVCLVTESEVETRVVMRASSVTVETRICVYILGKSVVETIEYVVVSYRASSVLFSNC